MDNNSFDLVYFVNSQGKRAVLSSPDNRNYWELRGRSGFTAPDVDNFVEKFADGTYKFFGKAFKPRSCTMRMVCVGENSAERDRLFFEMLDILLDADGEGEGRLYVMTSSGAMAYLNCVYAGGMNIVEQYQKLHLFTVEFYAADPWFYIDQVFEITGTTGSVTIKNPLTLDTYPEFYFSDAPHSLDNPVYLYNATTDKVISFYEVRDDNNVIIYYKNVRIYTGKPHGQIFGEEDIGDSSVQCPALIGGDLSVLNFPLVPGDNEISWQLYGYNIGTITMKFRKAGV